MRHEFREITMEELRSFFGGVAYPGVEHVSGAFVDGKMVAVCGILCDPIYYGTMFEENGRRIGFIDATEDVKKLGYKAILAVRDYLKKVDRDLYVQCDEHNYSTAPKLLRVLGFIETDEFEKDARNTNRTVRIWKWQR